MSTEQDLVPVLKKLKLSGVLHTLDLRIRQAVDDDVPHVEFLYRLLHDEVERREAKQRHLRLTRAKFTSTKALQDFDFRFNLQIPKAKVIDLATCSFIERQENVLLVGPAGSSFRASTSLIPSSLPVVGVVRLVGRAVRDAIDVVDLQQLPSVGHESGQAAVVDGQRVAGGLEVDRVVL